MSLCSFIIILHQQYALLLIIILLLYSNIASHFSLTNFQFHCLLLFLYSFFSLFFSLSFLRRHHFALVDGVPQLGGRNTAPSL